MAGAEDIGRAVIAGAADAVVASDREGRIILWNPGATRIFGFAESEALGQSLDIIVPEPYRARHWAGYDETIKTGESRYGAGDILAVPGLHKDGTRISIEFTITLVTGADRKVEAMAAIIRDVTKKFEDMKALKMQIAELKKS